MEALLITVASSIYIELVLFIVIVTQLLKKVKFLAKVDSRILTGIVSAIGILFEYWGRDPFNFLSAGLSVLIAAGGYSLLIKPALEKLFK
jgi:hypothetical protein